MSALGCGTLFVVVAVLHCQTVGGDDTTDAISIDFQELTRACRNRVLEQHTQRNMDLALEVKGVPTVSVSIKDDGQSTEPGLALFVWVNRRHWYSTRTLQKGRFEVRLRSSDLEWFLSNTFDACLLDAEDGEVFETSSVSFPWPLGAPELAGRFGDGVQPAHAAESSQEVAAPTMGRAAVCVTGQVRNFGCTWQPLLDYVVDGLGRDVTDVFFHGEPVAEDPTKAAKPLLSLLRTFPSVRAVQLGVPVLSSTGVWGKDIGAIWQNDTQDCPEVAPFYFRMQIPQFTRVSDCMRLIEAAEDAMGVRYDWVLRVRYDLVFHRPLPPLRLLSNPHLFPRDRIYTATTNRQFHDPFAVMPRALADSYMHCAPAFQRCHTVASLRAAGCPEEHLNWHERARAHHVPVFDGKPMPWPECVLLKCLHRDGVAWEPFWPPGGDWEMIRTCRRELPHSFV